LKKAGDVIGRFVMQVKPQTVARYALNTARTSLPADFYEEIHSNNQ